MKYGSSLSGPSVVSVHGLRLRWNSSAVARHARAEASSPLILAIRAAASRPAISAEIVEGEKPLCSSQRSGPNDGPWLATKFAAGGGWCRADDPPRGPPPRAQARGEGASSRRGVDGAGG